MWARISLVLSLSGSCWSNSTLSMALFYALMHQMICVPFLFLILEACLSLFWPDPEGFVWHFVPALARTSSQTAILSDRCGDSKGSHDWSLSKRVHAGHLLLPSIVQTGKKKKGSLGWSNLTLRQILRRAQDSAKRITIAARLWYHSSVRKCSSSQWQLVLWPSISLPTSQGLCLFAITVARELVTSLFGWEKCPSLPSRIDSLIVLYWAKFPRFLFVCLWVCSLTKDSPEIIQLCPLISLKCSCRHLCLKLAAHPSQYVVVFSYS